jgi:hypothetical protein
MEEQWKQILEYVNYEVSSYGNVRNKKTGRILKPARNGGYLHVSLSSNKIQKSFSVHQLIARCFIDNPENKPQVNHIDKDGTNNKLSNLEWVTAAENTAHKLLTLEVKTNQNLKIWRVDKNSDEKLELYNSIYDASVWCVEHGYSPSTHNARGNISYALNGRYKSSCGFKWVLDKQPNLENEIWKNITINGTTNYNKYSLHQLVASTFIDNLDKKPIVNHIDGNKINNCISNLEWVTIQENNQHNHNIGLIKTFKRKIGQYNLEGDLIKEYNSIVNAEKELGIQTIKNVLCNKQKTAGGFIWKYLD